MRHAARCSRALPRRPGSGSAVVHAAWVCPCRPIFLMPDPGNQPGSTTVQVEPEHQAIAEMCRRLDDGSGLVGEPLPADERGDEGDIERPLDRFSLIDDASAGDGRWSCPPAQAGGSLAGNDCHDAASMTSKAPWSTRSARALWCMSRSPRSLSLAVNRREWPPSAVAYGTVDVLTYKSPGVVPRSGRRSLGGHGSGRNCAVLARCLLRDFRGQEGRPRCFFRSREYVDVRVRCSPRTDRGHGRRRCLAPIVSGVSRITSLPVPLLSTGPSQPLRSEEGTPPLGWSKEE